jgi:hypothetical protein
MDDSPADGYTEGVTKMNPHRTIKGIIRGVICLTSILFVLSGCGGTSPPAKGTAEKAGTIAEKQSDNKAADAARETEAGKKKARDENIVKALEKVSKDVE